MAWAAVSPWLLMLNHGFWYRLKHEHADAHYGCDCNVCAAYTDYEMSRVSWVGMCPWVLSISSSLSSDHWLICSGIS